MASLRARVEKGRIVAVDPTDLPEGTLLELHDLVVVDGENDDLDAEERRELRTALEKAFKSVREGDVTEGDGVFRRLLR